MDWELLFFVFILLIFAGISYLVTRFFNRWTAKSQYKTAWNVLIFVGSLALILFTSFVIFMMNVNLGR
ncbi:hypothetical protein NZD88_03050 [Chryseobacterium antibioticum]|uniref:Uncharacterized protein n=1 Tax=Chryseobacterium pyrolae TaxID=2987481 RepID=A0ABT2ID17_9FLAO|nr:hypothetical protein [Chryseobacterium pyrolae]MCT2406530.1 hypothetical protein [Chryseobacterium pyrolae]